MDVGVPTRSWGLEVPLTSIDQNGSILEIRCKVNTPPKKTVLDNKFLLEKIQNSETPAPHNLNLDFPNFSASPLANPAWL